MFLMIMYITILSGCTTWRIPASVSDAQPPVFPDYKDITEALLFDSVSYETAVEAIHEIIAGGLFD